MLLPLRQEYSANRVEDIGNCSHVAWSGPPGTFANGMILPLARTVRASALIYCKSCATNPRSYCCLRCALLLKLDMNAPAAVVDRSGREQHVKRPRNPL